MRNRTENQIEIDITWIRHGRTKANEEHRYLGKTEEPLSEEGIRQLLKKRADEGDTAGDFLFSSPMQRCIQTAEILCDRSPILIPEWTEMDFGRFEGKNYQELCDDPYYQKWIDSGGMLPFPEGESREQFIARSMQGFWHMLSIIRKQTETKEKGIGQTGDPCKKDGAEAIRVTAVVHGGTIMAVLSTLTGGEYFDFQVGNADGYRMRLWDSEKELPEDSVTVRDCHRG